MKFLTVYFIFVLQNYDFEEWQNGSPLYWDMEHPQAIPVFKESLNVYSGNLSVKVVKQSATTSYRTALSQEINPIAGGLEYSFGVYVFDNDTNVYARVVITWYKDSSYLTYSMTSRSEDLNYWQTLSAIRQAPDTANRAIFKINIYPEGANATGQITYDLTYFNCCGIKEHFRLARERQKRQGILLKNSSNQEILFDIFGRKRKEFKNGIYFKNKRKIILIR